MDRAYSEYGARKSGQNERQSPYAAILSEQRPQHQWDEFSIKHPKMSRAGRAKIFMPYDALKGYKEAVHEKEKLYESKRQLSGEETERINTRLACLISACASRKSTGQPLPSVSIRYFTEVPLSDEDILLGADPYVVRGQYQEVSGPVRKISPYESFVMIGDSKVRFEDIDDISGILFSHLSDSYAE